MQTPIALPIPKVRETQLLTEIASEAHIGDWKDLRWFAVGSPPRSIVIVKRGKYPLTVCTISKTNNPDAWESWKPVLAEWLVERANSKRVNHSKLKTGKI